MNETTTTPAASWVTPRLVPLSSLDRAAAGASTTSTEGMTACGFYAPPS